MSVRRALWVAVVALELTAAGCRDRRSSGRAASTGSPASAAALQGARCPRHSPPISRGRVADARLDEISGLAASRRARGILWAHNDSGDSPRVFALTDTGRVVATYAVRGASAFDWEDVAVARNGDGWDLLVGDIGDNARARTDIVVYRFAEPEVAPGAPAAAFETEPARTLRFRYGDGRPHDAEALAVDPRSGDLLVVTKETGAPAIVFRAAAPFDGGGTLERVAEVDVGAGHGKGHRVTAADISADGRFILFRTYLKVLLFERRDGESPASALVRAPCELPPPDESQGEAAAFTADGRGVLTTSELEGQPLHFIALDP